MNYVTAKEAKEKLHINATTLMNWKRSGKIKHKVLSSKKVLYDIDSLLKENLDEHKRLNVIYARVSNTKQHNDLQSQIETLKNYCLNTGIKPDNIFSEIASGMNDTRKEYNKLIDLVLTGQVERVYITFKDRLTRFGFEHIQLLFQRFNTEIIVIDEFEDSNKDFQQELTEDLISIIQHFSMKLYSNRRKKLKQIKEIIEDKE